MRLYGVFANMWWLGLRLRLSDGAIQATSMSRLGSIACLDDSLNVLFITLDVLLHE
jgi:hypothetical protein